MRMGGRWGRGAHRGGAHHSWWQSLQVASMSSQGKGMGVHAGGFNTHSILGQLQQAQPRGGGGGGIISCVQAGSALLQ